MEAALPLPPPICWLPLTPRQPCGTQLSLLWSSFSPAGLFIPFSLPLRRRDSLSHSNLPRATSTRHQRLTTRSNTCFVLNSTSGPSLCSDYATILFCLTSLVPSVDPALSVLPKAQRTMGRYPVQLPAPGSISRSWRFV